MEPPEMYPESLEEIVSSKEGIKRFYAHLKEMFDRDADYVAALFPDRPHAGQQPERNQQEVFNLTMRDVEDCFVIGCFEASGLSAEDYPRTVYDLPWDDMDPIAVRQQMMCAIEKRMGIYPNCSRLISLDVEADPLAQLEKKNRELTSALESIYRLLTRMRPEPESLEAALKCQAEIEFWRAR